MKKTALIIIDVQEAIFAAKDSVFQGERLTQRLNVLLQKARNQRAPIFYVQHNGPLGSELEHGTPGWEIYSKIVPHGEDGVIQKTTPDSFHQTNLDAKLKEKQIERVVLAGIQTECCVDTTCRRASSMDYEVVLATDAHSTWDSDELSARQIIAHHNRIFRWFAETTPVSGI